METGATDTDSRKDPKGLFLRWDGREVQWAWMFRDSVSQESEFSFGHRAVSKISMLPEVLRALKGRFSTVNEVVYTQRFARTTIVPAIVLKDDSEAADKWFKLHHAPATDVGLRIRHLESIEGEPVFVEGLDEDWEESVKRSFPQAQGVIQSAVLMQTAISISRQIDVWVVVIDAGKRGADFAASYRGNAVWSGHSLKGDPESILYSVVNAMHRNGVEQDGVAIRFAGLIGQDLHAVFKRFFSDTECLGQSKLEGLKLLSK